MTAFATLDDLIAASIGTSNTHDSDPIKHVTPDDVRALCVTPLVPVVARARGSHSTKPTPQIAGFGYVDA